MKTGHSSLEADTGLLVERLGVVPPERDWELADGAIPHFKGNRCPDIINGLWPPFAPWWTDEDIRLFLPRKQEWWGSRAPSKHS